MTEKISCNPRLSIEFTEDAKGDVSGKIFTWYENLDRAHDDAAQYLGRPIEVGTWEMHERSGWMVASFESSEILKDD